MFLQFADCTQSGKLTKRMSASIAAADAAPLPVGMIVQPVAPVLRQIGQAMGVKNSPDEQFGGLPPWTQEEADAFERSIEETCEQVEP